MATPVSNTTDYNALLGGNATNPTTKSSSEQADRFLKLLVAQVQNQDPLSPMENSEVTTQMAQINTVTGIEKLNSTVESLSGQFLQMQLLQGANLVGSGVLVPGNQLSFADGKASGAFELTSPAGAVEVEVVNARGDVVRTIKLGAKDSGVHPFSFDAAGATESSGLSFRIKAVTGENEVSSTPLMNDEVASVVTRDGTLKLQLQRGGSVAYNDVRQFQ